MWRWCFGGSSCEKRLEFLRLMQDSVCIDRKKAAALKDFYQISSFVGAISSLVQFKAGSQLCLGLRFEGRGCEEDIFY